MRWIKHHYGLTPDAWEKLTEKNGGKCHICSEDCVTGRRLSVDHNHRTDKVRGLLCGRCNQALGHMRDDPELLRKAAEYLEQ